MDIYDKMFHIRKDRENRLIPMVDALDDTGKFHMWIPKGQDIMDCKVIDLNRGIYFAKEAHSNEDIFFGFIDFLHQRNTIKSIFPFVNYIINDMWNLAASLRKLEIYHEISSEEDIQQFVISELEYILVVCRSLYDYFQVIVCKIWDNIKLKDPAVKKKSLRESFGKMVLRGESGKTSEELREEYGLPPQLAKFYSDAGAFFKKIRGLRDDIVHRGVTVEYVYIHDRGFSVSADHKLFSSFGVWTPECYYPNDKLASLKPVIAYIVRETLATMNRFVDVLIHEIGFPDDIAPEYLLFMRGKYIHKLAELDAYIKKDVWYSPK